MRHTVATSRRFRRRRRLMMPMTVGGFPQTTRSSSSSIAHHHRPRVLRSDDDSLPKLAVVIPTVAIRDGDETHLVVLLVVYMWSSMCLEVVFKCILVSTSISRRITTVHFRACVYLSISLSLFLCVYVCSSFVTVVNDIRLLLCHAFMSVTLLTTPRLLLTNDERLDETITHITQKLQNSTTRQKWAG